MVVSLANRQRRDPVDLRAAGRLARRAARRLRIRVPGELAITFLDGRRMRQLNRRFLGQDRSTDVLSFRYPGEPIVGEIFIAPAEARAYALRHRLPYDQELSRYIVHGLLHWLGHDDRTPAQQRTMRAKENELLNLCGFHVL